jgi:hypothetical protein
MINRRKSLKRTLSVFGLALIAALATAALAAGGASALSYVPSTGKFPSSHTYGSTSLITFKNNNPYFHGTCSGPTTASGSGRFDTGTSGIVQLQFNNCSHPYYGQCTSPGRGPGTIATSVLNMKPVYLDAAKTQYGLLLSPTAGSGGVFADMTCSGLYKSTWYGSLIAPIKSPGLNVSSSTFQLTLDGPHQIEGAGVEYKLTENGSTQPLDLRGSSITMSQPGFTGKFVP